MKSKDWFSGFTLTESKLTEVNGKTMILIGKKLNTTTLINLKSVACQIDIETGMVSPICENGEIDFINSLHIDDHSQEWFESLSKKDLDKLK